ncbi:MAG: hypothetical protein K6A97_10485, partial [Lachnospiraceae bacterium]|nr:hypothetical protein [Lachnospiraceae bacterium]
MRKLLYCVCGAAVLTIALALWGRIKDDSFGHSLYNTPFSFYGVLSKDRLPSLEDIDRMIDTADNIAEVTATEEIRSKSVVVVQKVTVNKVYKGSYIPGDEIEIISENGIKGGMNWGVTNLMEPGNDYLVVLKTEEITKERNHINLYLGPIPLHEGKRTLIDLGRTYTYEELRGVDFFVEDDE